MTSRTDICNMALSHIANSRIIEDIDNLRDTSKEASLCRRFYDHCVNLLLSNSHINWGFSIRRTKLAIASENNPTDWCFVYQYPNDCLKAVEFLYQHNNTYSRYNYYDRRYGLYGRYNLIRNRNEIPFEIGNLEQRKVIFSNYDEAELIYVAKITDTSKMSIGFIDCLTYLLASKIAIGLTNKKALRDDNYSAFLSSLDKARVTDTLEEEEGNQDYSEILDYRGNYDY